MRRLLIALLLVLVTPAYAQTSWHDGDGNLLDIGDPLSVPAVVVDNATNYLLDPSFETWTVVTGLDRLPKWTLSCAGGALHKETTVIHGGSFAARLNAGTGPCSLNQSNTLSGLPFFGRGCVWAQGTGTFILAVGTTYSDVFTLTSDWQQYCSGRHITYNASPFVIKTYSPNSVLYVDDATYQQLLVPSLFALQTFDNTVASESVNLTEAPDNVSGLAQFKDATNFCVAVVQPIGATYGGSENSWRLHLACIIAGVTHPITDAPVIVYAPGAILTMSRDGNSAYTISYNGVTLGTWSAPYSVLDCAYEWGLFSSDPGSSFSNYAWTSN